MDEKAFGAMAMPILNMINAVLPDVKEVETKPGKFVENLLEDIMKDSPFYSLIRKVVLPQIEEDPNATEKTLAILSDRLISYFGGGKI